ncbi:MAG TPA: hypothetical protein VEA99_15160, partial [Gemmatimonadaceae bacterium]|nr:hypothetical protein [Gemmatimonadaceae bacterium]
EAWTTPQTGFLLLRAGPLLHVYRWQWRAARADSARTLGPGLVMDVDLRRQGQGITGWSF